MAGAGSQTKRIEAAQDGSVLAYTETLVSEQEITEERESIVIRLHAAYLNLTDQMSEFQSQWDGGPGWALVTSYGEGLHAGSDDWIDDQADLFKAETWVNLGSKIKDAAGSTYDTLAGYVGKRYDNLKNEINKNIENPDDTLYNYAWWRRQIENKANELIQQEVQRVKDFERAAQSVIESVEKAKKAYKHRDAILNLPALIAQGDARAIQAFLDNVVQDIDPALYNTIRHDPDFYMVLEIIADHDSALSYVSYVSLMIEAIPPNFYAYLAGKGSAYLLIEVVMLIVTALLSAGAAVAARIAALIGRIASASAKLATAGKRIRQAKAAIDAFIRLLEDFCRAADDLQGLGMKLREARSRGLVIRGNTKTTLKARKEGIRRDKKCRICGSTQHSTPRLRPGEVEYV
jgi:hypothetical protein